MMFLFCYVLFLFLFGTHPSMGIGEAPHERMPRQVATACAEMGRLYERAPRRRVPRQRADATATPLVARPAGSQLSQKNVTHIQRAAGVRTQTACCRPPSHGATRSMKL